MSGLVFAGNWKMNLGPTAAGTFIEGFLGHYAPSADREVWFFPPAVSLALVADAVGSRPGLAVGAQNVYWEQAGAFTGETSVPMAAQSGATLTLVGHSERRHVFGETDADTGRKVRAALAGGLAPVLCVGEKLDEREAGATVDVVLRQLEVLAGLGTELDRVTVAYEPVWAIGTGKNATPEDAAAVHATVRKRMVELGATPDAVRILYGGSVKAQNVRDLVRQDGIDGVLVGGASIKLDEWQAITTVRI